MAKVFEGTAHVYVNVHGLITIARKDGGKLSAENVGEGLAAIVKAANDKGLALDRWAFYVPEINQKLARDDKALPLAALVKAAKNKANEVVLEAGKWGKPRISIRPKVEVLKTATTAEVIF